MPKVRLKRYFEPLLPTRWFPLYQTLSLRSKNLYSTPCTDSWWKIYLVKYSWVELVNLVLAPPYLYRLAKGRASIFLQGRHPIWSNPLVTTRILGTLPSYQTSWYNPGRSFRFIFAFLCSWRRGRRHIFVHLIVNCQGSSQKMKI